MNIEQIAIKCMLCDMRDNKLVVVKINYTRQVISENIRWYKDLCQMHSRPRPYKIRTIIKRCHVIKTLENWFNNKQTLYRERLESFVEKYIQLIIESVNDYGTSCGATEEIV